MAPVRVLMVIGCMGYGGAETMIMNLYRCIDREKVQFDFLVHKGEHGAYEDEIRALGGRIYHIDKYYIKNLLSYRRQVKDHLAQHPEHKIVHGHIGSSAPVYLGIAKRAGRVAVAHSHNTNATVHDLHALLWRIDSFPTRYIADYFFACSRQAAIDRFGARVAVSDRCRVLYNSIDCERFAFNAEARARVRRELGLAGRFVIGHVGRHTAQKNPIFMLNIMTEMHKLTPEARLLQVGEGEMTAEMQAKCRELGIEGAVIFAGAHGDVEQYYSAMDVFLFPSLWEGLGIVAAEAQTNGLPCVVSDAIPKEADIHAGLYHPVSLAAGPAQWAQELLKYADTPHRQDAPAYARSAGYDSRQAAEDLQAFYLALAEKNDAEQKA